MCKYIISNVTEKSPVNDNGDTPLMLAKAYQEMAGDFDVYQQIIDLFETEIAENWFLEIKLPFSKLFVNFLGTHQKINKSLLMCRSCHSGWILNDLLLFWFWTVFVKFIFGHLQKLKKVLWSHYKICWVVMIIFFEKVK